MEGGRRPGHRRGCWRPLAEPLSPLICPAKVLTIGFGLAIIAGGVRMLTAKPPKIDEEPNDSLTTFILWGHPPWVLFRVLSALAAAY